MNDLITYTDTFPAWKAIIWCFYPIFALTLINLITQAFNDDDDDQGGGKMIPLLQRAKG